jgi:hypothetical protein
MNYSSIHHFPCGLWRDFGSSYANYSLSLLVPLPWASVDNELLASSSSPRIEMKTHHD